MENKENQTNQENQTPQFNLNELVGKYDSKTGITEDIKNVLNSNNIPVELFESHIKVREIEQGQIKQKAIGVFNGDTKAHDTVIEWANKNLDENSLNSISSLINNPSTVEMALSGLKSQYEKATNKTFQIQQTQTPNPVVKNKNFGTDEVIKPTNNVVINSQADLVKMYKDPAYKSNPEFRNQVSKASVEARRKGII